jgi:beta-galactosidase
LVIALGGDYVVREFRYLPCSFHVSEDGVNWGRVVATGRFPRDAAEKEVVFTGKQWNFVRFVAHAEVNGMSWMSMAEINVLAMQ